MATAAQRQARRRAALAEQGLQVCQVIWPSDRLAELREIEAHERARHERALMDGGWPAVGADEALEIALARRQQRQ